MKYLILFAISALFVACQTGDSVRIDEDINLFTNNDLRISEIHISAESDADKGKCVWQKGLKDGTWFLNCRYIGYTLNIANNQNSQKVLKGKYKSKHVKSFYVQGPFSMPVLIGGKALKHRGYPGIVGMIFLSYDSIGNVIVENPPYVDRDGYKHYVQPTKYSSGSLGGLAIDLPYDYLERLVDHESKSVKAKIYYYRRGAYNSLAYDVYDPSTASGFYEFKTDIDEKIQRIKNAKNKKAQLAHYKRMKQFAADIYKKRIDSYVELRHAPDSTEENVKVQINFRRLKKQK